MTVLSVFPPDTRSGDLSPPSVTIAQFTAHQLQFELEARETLVLNEHKGSSIRGMFYRAAMSLVGHNLRGSPPPNPALDPIARLVAALDEHSERGQDTPRLYAIQPPLEPTCIYERGERLRFGISLFAWAMDLYPYIVLAVKQAERMGIGKHSNYPARFTTSCAARNKDFRLSRV